jgi:hypothetical protein
VHALDRDLYRLQIGETVGRRAPSRYRDLGQFRTRGARRARTLRHRPAPALLSHRNRARDLRCPLPPCHTRVGAHVRRPFEKDLHFVEVGSPGASARWLTCCQEAAQSSGLVARAARSPTTSRTKERRAFRAAVAPSKIREVR